MAGQHDSAIRSWFTGRLPDEWVAAGAPSIEIDRDEIIVTLTIDAPDLGPASSGNRDSDTPDSDRSDADRSDADRAEAIAGRIAGFRDDTKARRISIAREAEHRFERKVAWAVAIGDRTALFTHLAAPVMTRLRQPERQVLDTLVAANVARSRAEAVAWCVRLVGEHTDDWLSDLREAMRDVERVRDAGPDAA
jgi:hypothetical protein